MVTKQPFKPDQTRVETLAARVRTTMRETLDDDAYARINEKHQKRGSEKKYFDMDKWLIRKMRAIVFLGLDTSPPIDILDIGTGAGHFVYLSKYFGHSAWAIDLPGIAVYDDLCDWFGVEKQPFRVEARKPLPDLGQRFDLITAFMIGFNTKADGTLFTVEDWDWFLDDVRDNQLKPGGRLLLKMIRQVDRTGPKFGDPELTELFAKRGARLYSGSHALFEPLM